MHLKFGAIVLSMYQNQPREYSRLVSHNMVVFCYGICEFLCETRWGDFVLINVSLDIGTVFQQIFSSFKRLLV